MTLSTHAVAGAFVGALVSQNLAVAAVVGFASHFLLDAIPHWDYKLASSHQDRANPMNNDIDAFDRHFIIDLAKIGLDVVLGLGIVFLLFQNSSFSVIVGAFIGAVFGMLPDPLQFVYMKFRREPFVSLQKFHMFMHAKTHLDTRPVLGIGSQLILITFIIYLTHILI
jgi:hypothetical protein